MEASNRADTSPNLGDRETPGSNECDCWDEVIFESREYWERRYSNLSSDLRCIHADLESNNLLEMLQTANPSKSSKILVTGCGVSSLSPILYKCGYKHIVNVDWSENLIEQMATIHPSMSWVCSDVRDMSLFRDGSFDVIIDKACLDILTCYPFDECKAAVGSYMKEIFRLLSECGSYLLSSGQRKHDILGWLCLRGNLTPRSRLLLSWRESAPNDKNGTTFLAARKEAPSSEDLKRPAILSQTTDQLALTLDLVLKVVQDYKINKLENNPDNELELLMESYKVELRKIFRQQWGELKPGVAERILSLDYWMGMSRGLTISSAAPPTTEGPEGRHPAGGVPAGGGPQDTAQQQSPAQQSQEHEQSPARPMPMPPPMPDAFAESRDVGKSLKSLRDKGYFVLPVDWGEGGRATMEGILHTMESLKENGWPAAFVFLFDEPWHLLWRMQPLMESFLGKDCSLEASVYAWDLLSTRGGVSPESTSTELPPAAEDARADDAHSASHESAPPPAPEQPSAISYMSSNKHQGPTANFRVPHRDYNAKDANNPDGSPKLLTIWIPICDATLDNGCMYILPKQADDLFDASEHPNHLYCVSPLEQGALQLSFPLDKVRPLPAAAGSIVAWQGNSIHWGSSCSNDCEDRPRASIAMTWRVFEETPSKKEVEICARAPFRRHELLSLPFKARLSVIAKSLIMYCHWFPSFAGFDKSLIGA